MFSKLFHLKNMFEACRQDWIHFGTEKYVRNLCFSETVCETKSLADKRCSDSLTNQHFIYITKHFQGPVEYKLWSLTQKAEKCSIQALFIGLYQIIASLCMEFVSFMFSPIFNIMQMLLNWRKEREKKLKQKNQALIFTSSDYLRYSYAS